MKSRQVKLQNLGVDQALQTPLKMRVKNNFKM